MIKHSNFERDGFAVINSVFTDEQTNRIIKLIEKSQIADQYSLKSKHVFAVRRLLQAIPQLTSLVLTDTIQHLVREILLGHPFLTKAIYFDKPANSNWFVAFHQDLSISVNQRCEVPGYFNWTFKQGQHGVQPPVEVLENTLTIRIHLDDTTQDNGALRVVPGSHKHGIIRREDAAWETTHATTCSVKRGAVMLMRPLTLHASFRTTNGKRRRVIHLEFSNQELDGALDWLERDSFESAQ